MGNPAGVRRDFSALEKRRLAAVRLWNQGWGNSAIALRLGVRRQTVVRWAQQYRAQGRKGLRKSAIIGRPARLNPAQRALLAEKLLAGPEALGFPSPLWTCPRVSSLIQREFGVRYHAAHVWKILHELGWRPQRSAGGRRQ